MLKPKKGNSTEILDPVEKVSEQKNLNEKPVHVKTYSTKEGRIVPSHVAKRKKTDGDNSEEEPFQPNWNTILAKRHETISKEKEEKRSAIMARAEIENMIPKEPKAIRQLHLSETPYQIIHGDHVSTVLAIRDENEHHTYYRPEYGEKWETGSLNNKIPIKSGIQDGRLGHRAVVASEIGSVLGIDGIPQTDWTHITSDSWDHYTNQSSIKDWGEGALQRSSSEVLLENKFYSPKAFDEAVGVLGFDLFQGKLSSSHIHETPEFHEMVNSALENGGMDLAYFDYIIGNTDRHSGNLVIGKNSRGTYKFVGRGHSLSFPSNTKFDETSFKNTFEGIWNLATNHGQEIECSEKFKENLLDPNINVKIEGHLNISKLNDLEKQGVLERLSHVQDLLKETKTLNGNDLGYLIHKNLKSYNHE